MSKETFEVVKTEILITTESIMGETFPKSSDALALLVKFSLYLGLRERNSCTLVPRNIVDCQGKKMVFVMSLE